MIELTAEQRRELELDEPEAVDPVTNTTYVLVRKDVYERLRASLDDFDPREGYPFVDRTMAEDDANDPTLESYQ